MLYHHVSVVVMHLSQRFSIKHHLLLNFEVSNLMAKYVELIVNVVVVMMVITCNRRSRHI